MSSFTQFSKHAFERLGQRTKLTCNKVIKILDGKAFVNIGHKPGFQREHLLFFSRDDQAHFVAIRDPMVGKIVTILPIDYHCNLAWPPTQAQLEQAKALCPISTPVSIQEGPSTIRVSANFVDVDGKQKTKTIMSVPASDFNHDIMTFITNSDFPRNILEKSQDKGIEPDSIFSFILRFGSKGVPVIIDFRSGSKGMDHPPAEEL